MHRTAPLIVALLCLPVLVHGQTLPVPVSGKASFDAKTGVYAPPPPDREPEYRKGQTFFVLNTALLDYREPPDKTKDIRLQTLTLRKWDIEIPDPPNGNPDLYFTSLFFDPLPLFGAPSFSLSEANRGRTVDDLPMKPMVEDDNVRFLQRKYEGQTVYPYGNIVLQGMPRNPNALIALTYDRNAPLRVRRVVRVRVADAVSMGLGIPPGATDTRPGTRATTRSPLIVVLEPAAQAFPIGAQTRGLGRTETDTPDLLHKLPGYCAGFYVYRLDTWDFERAFSLSSPAHIARGGTGEVREAFENSELKRGMTPEMVARLLGFPAGYRTRAELLAPLNRGAWGTWKYPGESGRELMIDFEKGKMVGSYYQ